MSAAPATATVPREERWREWLAQRAPKLFLGTREEALPVVFDRKRIYTLPTRFGFFFGAVAMLCVFGGLNYNNNVVLMLAFLVAALGFVSLLYAFLNLRDLRVLSVHAQPTFAGSNAIFEVQLHAPTARDSVVIDYRQCAQIGGLAANSSTAFTLAVFAPTRGALALPPFRIWTDYPFGLFYAWSHVRVRANATVYPCPEPNAPLWHNAARNDGDVLMRDAGDDDMVGLKSFTAGDRAQRIAWSVYARSDELVVKDFRRAQSPQVQFDLHTLHSLPLETALSRLCAWILRAEDERICYGLTLGEERIGMGLGTAHRNRCLESLARYTA